MTYTKFNDPWENSPDGEIPSPTPINAAALEHIEDGIVTEDAARTAHEADSTAVHGITNTSLLLTTSTRLDQVAAPIGSVALNSQKITQLGSPTLSTDAVNKAYADGIAQGLDVKASVRAATTANITLSGTQTVDGVALIAADRILVKNQTTGSENGIYVVAAGAWSRSADADVDAEVNAGLFTFVEAGTTQADSGWVLTTNNPIALGTTALAFTQFSSTGGGAPTTPDYLVGTANASLSAEIVVGTTPGGELGGTWASPTVDATHSGSTHAAVQAAAEAAAASAAATTYIPKSLVITKGDLVASTANTVPARVAVGADGTVLTADAAQTTGMRWVTPAGGPPTGAAGGVLTGTYPNPTFAVDMATQAELNAVAGASTATLGAPSSVAATTLTVAGNLAANGIAVGTVIGVAAGTTNCEVRRVSAISGTTVTVSTAFKVAHSSGDNVWSTNGFYVPFEWYGAIQGSVSVDSYRALINAFLDQQVVGNFGLEGKGAATATYYSSRPLFVQDYGYLRDVSIQTFYPFAFDATATKWNGIPNQYFVTLAGQTGTATFNASTNQVTLSTSMGSATYSDVVFYPRPGATMPGGIEEGKRYFTLSGSLTTTITAEQEVTTPVDITSAGSGEIVVISTGFSRMMWKNVRLHGNYVPGLNGLIALVQQPSCGESLRIEGFPVVGATIAGQQGAFPNIMVFDCWTGVELAGAEMLYFPFGSIEGNDINVVFEEITRYPPGAPANRGTTIGEGFHFESPGQGVSQIQTLILTGTLTSGTFSLQFKNQTTSALNFNATAAQVQTALQALSTVGSGNVTVTQISGTNASNGPMRFDYTVGALKWQFFSGSTNTLLGGETAVVSSTVVGGTLAMAYQNPNGRNISYKLGIGNRVSGASQGSTQLVLGYMPAFVKFEGSAVGGQGAFQGLQLEDIAFFDSSQVAVDDTLHGMTLTATDTTGCGLYLAFYERPGRHGGVVGSHTYWMGDGGRRIKHNSAGAPMVELMASTAQTVSLLECTNKSGAMTTRVDENGFLMLSSHAAPADADLSTGEAAIWFDQTNGAAKLMVKAKQADGTVKTGSFNVQT